jgi:hypothetical protein
MKWLALVLIGCVLATAWARTIPTDENQVLARRVERSGQPDAQLRRDMQANLIALRRADLAYREMSRMDSLMPLLPAAPDVTVQLSPAVRPDTRDTVFANVARELVAMGEPRARIGIFLVDNAYGHRPGVPFSRARPEREMYAGVDSAGAYCAVVHSAPVGRTIGMVISNSRVSASAGASMLGPCAFTGRYGAPGAEISRWLSDGAYRLAEHRSAVLQPGVGDPTHERELTVWSEDDRALRGCIGGRDDLCVNALLMPTGAAHVRDGPAVLQLDHRFPPGANDSRAMLDHLEQEFGSSRFEAFWTSDADVPTAFAGAFGIGAGDWVHEWGRSRYGDRALGPRVDAVTLLLSALLVVGLIAVVVLTERRRTL